MVPYTNIPHMPYNRTVMFYPGNTIVKVIYEEYRIDDNGNCTYRDYTEFDTRLETSDRKTLVPLTSKGRAKSVTPTNVMAVDPFGCIFRLHMKKGESSIYVGNYRNHQRLAVGEYKRIHEIGSDEDLHGFMSYYCSTCPDDYFSRIKEIKTMPHQTVQFFPGDIFRCRTDRTHFAYGIIIGKTRDIEKWKELPAEHSFRHLMTQPIIVRMYDFITENGEMKAEELSHMPLRPPQICSDNEIIWGTHKLIGHKKLVPEDIQFGIHLARQRVKNEHFTPLSEELLINALPESSKAKIKEPFCLYFEWGFVQLDIPWENVPEKIRVMLEEGSYSNGGVDLGIVFSYCGKTLEEILSDQPKNIIRYDLLLPENRDKLDSVLAVLCLPENSGYDDLAKKYGALTRQEYIDIIEKIYKINDKRSF